MEGQVKIFRKMNNYPIEVMEVHNEFMTAGDTLLKKAEEILKTKVNINPAKIARLEAFGFKSSKDATALEDDKKEKSHQQKIVEAINYYRVKFPNYKFIPQETVKAICEKYGLVSGEAHQYKGFVPENNLTEIERFFEAYPDMRYSYFKPINDRGLFSSIWSSDIQIEKEEYDEIMASIPEPIKHTQSFSRGLDMDIPAKSLLSSGLISGSANSHSWFELSNQNIGLASMQNRRSGISDITDYYMKIYEMYSPYTDGNDTKAKTASKKETTLRICAPLSEMKAEGYELQDGYKLVYDPIVSIEVTHKNGIKGEIILTAWGDEASDVLVIDQSKN